MKMRTVPWVAIPLLVAATLCRGHARNEPSRIRQTAVASHSNVRSPSPEDRQGRPVRLCLRDRVDPDAVRRALREFESWSLTPQAPEIAELASRVDDKGLRADLAKRVLQVDIDAPLPRLREFFLHAAKAGPEPQRRRAIARLDAGDEAVAGLLADIAKGDAPVAVRYEALKRLQVAGKERALDALTREAILAGYDASPVTRR
ncbi:MAG: hypothetical protein HYY16_14840 [Planctomycetes bacterium]|nr:hypothetical protein [Planctomycetota bacterium]